MNNKFLLFYILSVNLFLKINCQDDDYDIEPDEISNEIMANEQPEFYKNAFSSENGGGGGSRTTSSINDLWAPYMSYFPFSNFGGGGSDSRSYYPPSPYYTPFPMPPPRPSFDSSSTRSTKGFHDKVKRRPDFFSSDFELGNSKPNPFETKPKSLEPHDLNKHHQMPSNGYQFPYNSYPPNRLPNMARFNPYQNNFQVSYPPHVPVGSHLFPPHMQQGSMPRKKDNFDEELKKLGINLDEFLGNGESNNEETKNKKDKRKKKDKKVKPISPTIIPFRQTTTENPSQNPYLKSHIDNDISNLGFNLDQYGIKEHKLEKQVYGQNSNNPQTYQYPMQANQFVNQNDQTNQNIQNNQQLMNQNQLFRNQGSLNGFDFDTINNLDTINSLLKYSPTSIHDTINPVFTAENAINSMNPMNNPLNDVATLLLEHGLDNLNNNNYRTHEYRANNDNEENFKFSPTKAPVKNIEKPPKFLEDEFFKEKSTKNKKDNDDDDKSDDEGDENEPEAPKKSRKAVVYKLNSEVRSNKYFESITPKPRLTSYSSNDNEKDNSSNDEEEENNHKDIKPRYNEKSKSKYNDEKPVYSKEYTNKPKKYSYGYRYYDQNNHPDDNYENKKGETMKLVGDKSNSDSTDEENSNSNDQQAAVVGKSNSDSTESNYNQEDNQQSPADDKYSEEDKNRGSETEGENSNNKEDDNNETNNKDEANETNVKETHQYNTTNPNNDSNDASTSDEEKIDDEFSGSKKRKKRSIPNTHYFSPLKQKLNKLNYLKRQDDDNEEDGEEDLIEDANRSREFYLKRKQEYKKPKLLFKRYPIYKTSKKIVSFDEPPANYVRRSNFESTASTFNDEEFDYPKKRTNKRFKRPVYRTLKDEYDDEFRFKLLKSINRKEPKLERRKCNGSLKLNRIYNRDDNYSYDNLSKNPMYKFYKLI